MKNYFRLSMIAFALASMLFVSCGKDDEDDDDTNVDNKFGTLKTYMVDNSLDVSNMMNAWVKTAEAVYNANTDADATNDLYVIDLRSAADFGAGHIENSVNSTVADILTTAANAGGKDIVVVCYTGQTASFANAILRLNGYPTAAIMKWGMSGWNATKDSWTANIGDVTTADNWVAAPGSPAANIAYGDPTVTSEKTTGAEILAEKVAAVHAAGYDPLKTTKTEVLGNYANYFVLNYWTDAIMVKYGHIKGAYRINPLTLAGDEYKNLPNDGKTITVYCWTGQTSSYLATYLKVLGYNTKTIMFGANGMIHSQLQENKWDVATQAKSYPLVSK